MRPCLLAVAVRVLVADGLGARIGAEQPDHQENITKEVGARVRPLNVAVCPRETEGSAGKPVKTGRDATPTPSPAGLEVAVPTPFSIRTV
jgi:hypothetical protein